MWVKGNCISREANNLFYSLWSMEPNKMDRYIAPPDPSGLSKIYCNNVIKMSSARKILIDCQYYKTNINGQLECTIPFEISISISEINVTIAPPAHWGKTKHSAQWFDTMWDCEGYIGWMMDVNMSIYHEATKIIGRLIAETNKKKENLEGEERRSAVIGKL